VGARHTEQVVHHLREGVRGVGRGVAVGGQDEQREVRGPFHEVAQGPQARLTGPVEVLQDEDDGTAGGGGGQGGADRSESRNRQVDLRRLPDVTPVVRTRISRAASAAGTWPGSGSRNSPASTTRSSSRIGATSGSNGWPRSAVHSPTRTGTPWACRVAATSMTSRDLPAPGSAETSTSCLAPCPTASQTRSSRSSSARRPTQGGRSTLQVHCAGRSGGVHPGIHPR